MRNAECEMRNDGAQKPRDIHERSLDYGVRAVRLFRKLNSASDIASTVVAKQYLRCATSIGANLAEAQAAETRADFVHKCSISQKESRECLYWLHLMAKSELLPAARLSGLIEETKELIAVITTIAKNARKRAE
jgi:four helix bundle protein